MTVISNTHIPQQQQQQQQPGHVLELSWYPFSDYTNFVADVNLASSLVHKSRREIRKNEALQSDKQVFPVHAC
jgi:hypothetical protein